MTMKNNNIFCLFIALLLCQQSFAGFPLGRGGYQVIPTYNFYKATSYWDKNRVLQTSGFGNFTSNYFSIYGGFGINRDLDFIYNVPYVVQRSISPTGVTAQTPGLGDATLGLCYYLNHYDNYKHLSFTGSLIVPLYQNVTEPYIGFQSTGLEGKLGLAGNSQMSIRNAYYDMEVGVRQYMSVQGPTQFFTNITGGKQLNDQWKMSGTFSGVVSNSSTASSVNLSSSSITLNRDFEYWRFTINAGYILNANTTIWGSLFKDVAGRNTGQGSGLALFLVYKL